MTLPRLTAAPRVDRPDPSFDVDIRNMPGLAQDMVRMYESAGRLITTFPNVRGNDPDFDDGPGIQRALDTYGAGTILWPRDTTFHTAQMLKRNTAIQHLVAVHPFLGQSTGNTIETGPPIIRATASINAVLRDHANRAVIAGITFDGDSNATYAYASGNSPGSQFYYCHFTGATSHGWYVEPGYDGFSGTGNCNHMLLQYCLSRGNGGDGFRTVKNATNNTNNIIYFMCNGRSNTGQGIVLSGTNQCIFMGDYSYNTGDDIWVGHASDNQAQDNIIMFPYVDASGAIVEKNAVRTRFASLGTGAGALSYASAHSVVRELVSSSSSGGFFDRIFGGTNKPLLRQSAPSNSLRITATNDDTDADLELAADGNVVANTFLKVYIRTDANRGAAGTAGRVIFNTTDGQLNIDDGTNWTLPDGTTT